MGGHNDEKNIFKTVTVALAAILAINSFSINSNSASAEEINSIETVETENSDERLIYEHKNEYGFIERMYLKNTHDNYRTYSDSVTIMCKLYDPSGTIEIANNEMYTAWSFDGAVPTYCL